MLVESKVTIATARYLGYRGWLVRSIALPNGGSGVLFNSSDKDYPAMIPDIIATHDGLGMAIAVESKPLFSSQDVRKLLSLKSGKYDDSIRAVAGVQSQDLVTCMAFSGPTTSIVATLGIDLVINVPDHGRAEVVFDGLKLFDGSN